MAGLDKKDIMRDERKRRRLEKEFEFAEKEKKRTETECLLIDEPDNNTIFPEPELADDMVEDAPRAKTRRDLVHLTLPANLSSHPDITACMDRIQLSSDKGSMLLSTIARVGGAKVG